MEYNMDRFAAMNAGYYLPNQIVGAPYGPGFLTSTALQNTQQKIPHLPTLLRQSTVNDIALWIYELARLKNFGNPDRYAETFRQHEINGRKIVGLKNEDFKDTLKITKLGHRLMILKAIGHVLKEEKSGLHNMMQHDSDQSPNLWKRPQISAPLFNQGSQSSNWESAPSGTECYRVNKKFQKMTFGGHLRYPVSDFDEHKRQPQNIRRFRRRSHGRPGWKAGRNHTGRVARRYQEKKSCHSLRGSSNYSDSREDMQSVSSTTSTIFQKEKESTLVLAHTKLLQDGKVLVMEEMQKSRKSEIAPKPEGEQKYCELEPLSSSSDEENLSFLPRVSSFSSCSRGSNQCYESKERCNGAKELHTHSREFGYPHVQSDVDAFAKSLENGSELKQKKPKTPRLSPEVIGWASTHSDKSVQLLVQCNEDTQITKGC